MIPKVDFTWVFSARDGSSTYPSSVAFLLPALPLFLQAILLHPKVPETRAFRVARLLLAIPGVLLSLLTPIWYQFDPVELSVPANLRWGMFGIVFAMRSLEWGIVSDRSPYTWVGFGRDKAEGQTSRSEGGEVARSVVRETGEEKQRPSISQTPSYTGTATPDTGGTTPETGATTPEEEMSATDQEGLRQRKRVSTLILDDDPVVSSPDAKLVESGKRAREHETVSAATSHPVYTVLADSLHLLTALRGIGYAFGPSRKHVPPVPKVSERAFLEKCLRVYLFHHALATVGMMFLAERHVLYTMAAGTPLLPAFSLISHLLIGVCIHSQMYVGTEQLAVYSWLFNALARRLLPETYRPLPFDSREYPPPFDTPLSPRSLSHFWSSQWHALFRSQFIVLGFRPGLALGRALGSKSLGRVLGTVIVFAYSAFMHDFGFHTAHWHTTYPATAGLTWIQRNGNTIYFMGQAFGVILESLLLRRYPKGHRVHVLYSYFFVVVLGLVAAHTWLLLGAADPLPRVSTWTWERFLIPSASLLPKTVFVKGAQ